MKDRIRQIMDAKHLTQQNFAEMLQISPASLSSIFNDRTKPTLNIVDAIKKSFPGINLQWLLYGEGDMFGTSTNDAPRPDHYADYQGEEPVLDFGMDTPAPPQQPTIQSSHQNTSQGPYRRENVVVKINDKPQRQITEIRIFYDDQTWETFVPKK